MTYDLCVEKLYLSIWWKVLAGSSIQIESAQYYLIHQ